MRAQQFRGIYCACICTGIDAHAYLSSVCRWWKGSTFSCTAMQVPTSSLGMTLRTLMHPHDLHAHKYTRTSIYALKSYISCIHAQAPGNTERGGRQARRRVSSVVVVQHCAPSTSAKVPRSGLSRRKARAQSAPPRVLLYGYVVGLAADEARSLSLPPSLPPSLHTHVDAYRLYIHNVLRAQ